jgi:CSLREA domain-containing protein
MNTQRWNRVVASAIMGLCLCSTAEAVITVTTADDVDGADGFCSLREAIIAINQLGDQFECTFAAPLEIKIDVAGPIILEDDLPPLEQPVKITGPVAASVVVSGNNSSFRIFQLLANTGAFTISRLTIKDGSSGAGSGAITLNTGNTLLLSDSTVTGSDGIGVFIGTTSTLTMERTTIDTNTGNGLHFDITSTGNTITNSTISSNSGTGIFVGATAGLTMFSSTVTNNTVAGLSNGGMVTVNNTIFSGNAGGNCTGTQVNSLGHNLDSKDVCGLIPAMDDLIDRDPLLEGLKDNGGPTLTHALKGGIGASPAINNGDCPTLVVDQRGAVRPSGSACDIGAYERQPGDRRGGGSGSGCSSRAGKNAVLDPTLWLLVLVSCIYLGYRRSYPS